MAAEGSSPLRSAEKLRQLNAEDLGLLEPKRPADGEIDPEAFKLELDPDDSRLAAVTEMLATFGGVIFTGPPGTSKSWYARQIAIALTDGDPYRSRFVQFHPSYQYEDFVEGFVPVVGGGFNLDPKHLLSMAQLARNDPGNTYVIVIDELSRGDPARIFGEALTYVERTKRGLRFRLSSGREDSIPTNLAFIATMNPLDRGVDEVDAAFERRFSKIAFDPDVEILGQFLASNDVDAELKAKIIAFFQTVQSRARDNPYAKIGHTYFLGVRDRTDLEKLWNYQLRFVFEKAYRLDPQGFQDIKVAWSKMTAPVPPVPEDVGEAGGQQAAPVPPAVAGTPEVGAEQQGTAPSAVAGAGEGGAQQP